MSEFKAGDRVRVLANTCSHDQEIGSIVTLEHMGARNAIVSNLPAWGIVGSRCYISERDIERVESKSIHITTDGKTTHAVLKEGGKVSKRAKAVCSPHDEFDFNTGARIAFDRLCTSLAENSAFKGVREVKRPAKVGEWVKFIKDHGGELTPGSIHRVEFECDGTLCFTCNCICSCHDQYVVLEGYTPEPEKPKYYNGKVVCVDLNGLNLDSYTVGKVYAIVDGVLTNDKGKKINPRNPVKSFDEWCKFSSSKFIEFKGEA